MFRISRFQRLMQGVPRNRFDRIVEEHGADRYAKSFGCFDLLVALVFGQLNGSRSLRELQTGFNAHGTHHYHLGTRAVRRTTLADACGRRDPRVFEELARTLMATAQRKVRRQADTCLRLLDSTSITLQGRDFDTWAASQRTRHTQGLKVHVVYAPEGAVPTWQAISAANVNDITQAATLPLESSVTYVFDKGYCDYNWWAQIDAHGAQFVTRLKRNAKVAVVKCADVLTHTAAGVLADETIRFANPNPGAGRKNRYTAPLRRITVSRPDHDTDLVLVTNDFTRSASDVADAYKARWQIELFFKWIKQNLRIKSFLGRSENAVRTQILCALITYLLVALHRLATAPHIPLIRMLDELRAALFQRPDLDAHVEHRRRTRLREYLAIQPGLL